MSDDREWLDGLKAGDLVHVSRGYSRDAGSIRKVHRRTPTQIILLYRGAQEYEVKFRAKDGRAVAGDAWSRDYLSPPTQEKRDAVERERLANKARHFNFSALPLDHLRRIVAILDEPKDPA